jgi:predicted RNase H-like HicB family nuclease
MCPQGCGGSSPPFGTKYHARTHLADRRQMETWVRQRVIKAVIRPGEESGFVGECLDIPVVTQGRTLDEVYRNLQEAVELHLGDDDL